MNQGKTLFAQIMEFVPWTEYFDQFGVHIFVFIWYVENNKSFRFERRLEFTGKLIPVGLLHHDYDICPLDQIS